MFPGLRLTGKHHVRLTGQRRNRDPEARASIETGQGAELLFLAHTASEWCPARFPLPKKAATIVMAAD
jgi:hypothetical protein